MSNFFQRDPRIDPESAIRDLEKKLHYALASLAANGLLLDPDLNNIDIANEIGEDAQEVARSQG
jgi:hypothetical protein